MYASDYPFWEDHYVAVENGKIRGTLSVTRMEREHAGVKLVYGHVGQVSVHPYARGEGHMKKLMTMADEDMRAGRFDLAELNGLRQRYEYFGYTQSDCRLRAHITPTNVRHALGNRAEELMDGMTARVRDDNTAWEKRWDILNAEGQRLAMAGPGTLETDALDKLPELCGVFFRFSGEHEMTVSAALYDTARVRALTAFCEDVQLSTGIEVTLVGKSRGKGAKLTVSNTYAEGKDVDYSRFFERFYREDASHNSAKAWFGIGLSMGKEIAERMGGKLKVSYAGAMISFVVEL